MEIQNKYSGKRLIMNSQKSRLSRMKRRVVAWAKYIAPVHELGETRMVMIRLSYAPEFEWQPKDITTYLQKLKRHTKDGLLAYAWVAEMQKRGAVHYHIILLAKRGTDIPKPDDSEMWPHGSSRIETAKSPWYIVTYVGKEYQKEGFPKGIRVFAVWAKPDLDARTRFWVYRMSAWPMWLQNTLKAMPQLSGLVARPKHGGGWYIKVPPEHTLIDTNFYFESGPLKGEFFGDEFFFESPWKVIWD